MPNVVTEGIVLKRSNYGETDRILTLYTKQLGKTSAIAKGVRRASSRSAGHLEPGNVVRLELAQGKNLHILTGARVVHYYQYSSLPAMQALFTWLELIAAATREDEPNPHLFRFVTAGLQQPAVSNNSVNTITLLELGLYSTIGYTLEADQCIIGREDLKEQHNVISLARGGMICATHAGEAKDAFPISTAAIKCLRLINRGDWNVLQSVQLPQAVMDELRKIVHIQRHHILERELKTEHL